MQTQRRSANEETAGAAREFAVDSIPNAFRAHFARHNRRVLFLAFGTAIGAVALWLTLYFVGYWFILLSLSAVYGIDANVPFWFLDVCVASGFLLCLATWAVHRLAPYPRARDRSSVIRLAFDLLLAVPRATMSVWGTLSAYQFFSERDLALAFRLLQRIEQVPRLSLQSVPLEIPDARLQDKIIHGLQIVDLIDLTKNSAGWWLTLRDRSVRALCHHGGLRLKSKTEKTV